MNGRTHVSESRCPDCGNDQAIVRVRGNAISSVCTVCRRADVDRLLDEHDLLLTGEIGDAELFELDAARSGAACGVVSSPPDLFMLTTSTVVGDNPYFGHVIDDALSVELRLPVPPR